VGLATGDLSASRKALSENSVPSKLHLFAKQLRGGVSAWENLLGAQKTVKTSTELA